MGRRSPHKGPNQDILLFPVYFPQEITLHVMMALVFDTAVNVMYVFLALINEINYKTGNQMMFF